MNMDEDRHDQKISLEELNQFFEENEGKLKVALRQYVWKFGLSHNATQRDTIADELFTDLYLHARAKVHQVRHPSRLLMWLNKVAATQVLQRLRKHIRDNGREPLIAGEVETEQTEAELLDLLAQSTKDPASLVEQDDYVEYLLSLLPDKKRAFLELALTLEMKPKLIAIHLQISNGAARTKLFRVLQHLRQTLENIRSNEETHELISN